MRSPVLFILCFTFFLNSASAQGRKEALIVFKDGFSLSGKVVEEILGMRPLFAYPLFLQSDGPVDVRRNAAPGSLDASPPKCIEQQPMELMPRLRSSARHPEAHALDAFVSERSLGKRVLP